MKNKLPGDEAREINTASIENNGEGPQKFKNKTSINLTAVYGSKENESVCQTAVPVRLSNTLTIHKTQSQTQCR